MKQLAFFNKHKIAFSSFVTWRLGDVIWCERIYNSFFYFPLILSLIQISWEIVLIRKKPACRIRWIREKCFSHLFQSRSASLNVPTERQKYFQNKDILNRFGLVKYFEHRKIWDISHILLLLSFSHEWFCSIISETKKYFCYEKQKSYFGKHLHVVWQACYLNYECFPDYIAESSVDWMHCAERRSNVHLLAAYH